MTAKKEPDRHFGVPLVSGWRNARVNMEMLESSIKRDLNDPKLCATCGSIPFYIQFSDGTRTYYFGCWKITEEKDGKETVLIETDYKKFRSYIKP